MKTLAGYGFAALITGTAITLASTLAVAQHWTPSKQPTEAITPIGPADPALRVVSLPTGKRLHLLPATLETTQWGWFDNAQPPVLRINSGDTVALETMMHSHNQVVPGT